MNNKNLESMNILFVWTSPFKNAGGVGRVTTTLGQQFVKRGHNVTYLSFSKGSSYSEEGIDQLFVPSGSGVLEDDNLQCLVNVLADRGIDVIINQAGITNADVLKAINRARDNLSLKELKVYSVHHNCISCLYEHFELTLLENSRKSKYYRLISNPVVVKILKVRHKRKYRKIYRYLIDHSDKLVLLSDKFIPELNTYINLDTVPAGKITGISNPAPFEVVKSEEKKENRLLFVGRIGFHQKRCDLLIPLWKNIQETFPDWEFDIVGDGDVLSELKKMAENAGLERIHFHGFDNPVPYLEKAKFFTMTSAFEGFGMVLVEAQAYGVVPVAFNSFGSLSDIITDKENGVVISPYDVDEYSDRLATLMRNEPQRKKLATAAQKSVSLFSPDRIAGQWEELFSS